MQGREEGRPGSRAGAAPLPQRLFPGRACAVARCANRRLPEAAGTGWNRLEPVTPARKPTPHKGRRRLTARVSLRRAGVGGCRAAPLPQPGLLPRRG